MNQNALQKKFINLQKALERISYLLYRARQLDVTDFKEYCELTYEAAHGSEKMACAVRDLVVNTTFCDKNLFMADIVQTLGITITKEEYWYQIIIPALLPKKHDSHSCAYIVDPLRHAMEQFTRENKPERLRESVVCFRHIYQDSMPERAVRDHDNIEVKKVLDVIADKLLTDDNGYLCSNLYTSAKGDKNSTEVYIMHPQYISEWLQTYPIQEQ